MPKALKNIIKFQLIWVLSYLLTVTQIYAWHTIAPGIQYQDVNDESIINITHTHIHAFKIDLKHNKFGLAFADSLHDEPAFANNFAKKYSAVIAINGGFFDKSFHPLGLRISNNHQYNSLKPISWWGVFYINNNKPYIKSANSFERNQNISFAVQSGPRLIINGNIPKLKPGYAERTALGITRDGQVIILVTQNTPITTTELATIMNKPPLQCENAINLDGGSSSQLYVNLLNFKLNVSGFSEVSDSILVTPY